MWLPLALPVLGTRPTTQARAMTGNQTGDPFVRRLALNTLSHTSQDWSLQFLKEVRVDLIESVTFDCKD